MQSYGIAPTAMTADHGYIAAGAQRGMVCVIECDILLLWHMYHVVMLLRRAHAACAE